MFSTLIISVVAFLFHVAISRIVGPNQYGLIGSMLSLLGFLVIPISALQLIVTQEVMEHPGKTLLLKNLLLKCGLISLALSVFGLMFAPIIDDYLNVKSALPYALVLLWVPFATMSAILQGVITARLKFVYLATSLFIGNAVVRVLLGLYLVSHGYGVSGVLLGTVIGQAVIFLCLLYFCKESKSESIDSIDPKIRMSSSLLSVASIGGATIFMGLDTVLSRHYLSTRLSGIYASAATASHIVFFFATALYIIAFPYFTKSDKGLGNARRVLIQFGAASLSFSLIVGSVFCIFPKILIKVLFGEKFIQAATIVPVLCLESLFVGLFFVLMIFHVAQKSIYALSSWFGIIVASLMISTMNKSMNNIAIEMLIASAITLAISGIPTLKSLRIQDLGVNKALEFSETNEKNESEKKAN